MSLDARGKELRSVVRDVYVWDAKRENAERADVVVYDGKIAAVAAPRTAEGELLFDGEGRTLLMPGLVNAHTHASMTLLRGLGEELPLMEWLTKKIFPIEEKLTPRHIKAGAELAFLEMLAAGTTCFADMYFAMSEVADSVLSSGMRAALCRGLPGFDEAKVAENIALADKYGSHDRINVQIGPHAPYTVAKDDLTRLAKIAKEKNIGIHFHWLETKGELDTFQNDWKIKPIDYLEETGLLDAKELILAHAVWFPVDELPRAARDNVALVHNPNSNLKLGSGYAPIKEMLAANVRVALGTDGAASNNRLDMWCEMRSAALMHKGYHLDPTLVTAREVLKMATAAGAEALGFENLGYIGPGYWADMMLVDLDQPHYVGWTKQNIPEFVVYAGSSRDVRATLVAGKMLYKDGEHLTLDRRAIMDASAMARRELLQ